MPSLRAARRSNPANCAGGGLRVEARNDSKKTRNDEGF